MSELLRYSEDLIKFYKDRGDKDTYVFDSIDPKLGRMYVKKGSEYMKPINEIFDEEYFLIEGGAEYSTDDCCEDLKSLSLADLKRLQRALTYATNIKMYGEDYYVKKDNTFDCCAKTPAAPTAIAPITSWSDIIVYYPQAVNTQNSMERDMNYNTPTTNLEAETRKFLLNDLSTIESTKYREAEDKYLPVTETPKDGKKLKEAIANGWLKVTAKDDTQFNWNSWLNYVELEDPSKPRDEKKFSEVRDLIAQGKHEAKRAIMVLPQVDGLAALQKFEGTTYH